MDTLTLEATSVGVIGYGEVGKIFAAALEGRGAKTVGAWDLNFADPDKADAERAHAAAARVRACASNAELMQASDLVFSAVTASHTHEAAREAARHARPGMVFVDLNSASPRTKTRCAALLEERGARYVEASIMTSVPPYGLRVPMLLGGPHAEDVAPRLRAWGLDATAQSDTLGVVSAIKMCRSVIVKGLEAIVIEGFTAARAYGVEDAVLASLAETFPGVDWEKEGTYFFQRVIRHGTRRADEMREAAATVSEVGAREHMAAATARRQRWVAALAKDGAFAGPADGWRSHADAALRAMAEGAPGQGLG